MYIFLLIKVLLLRSLLSQSNRGGGKEDRNGKKWLRKVKF